MSKHAGADLTKYLDKSLQLKLNGNRLVTGKLRGFDQFMNVVLDDTVEHRLPSGSKGGADPSQVSDAEKIQCGTVVIRGNSILMLEALERV